MSSPSSLRRRWRWISAFVALCAWASILDSDVRASASVQGQEPAAPVKVLFLGDRGHHRPADRFREIQPVLAARGIELIYSERVDDLNPRSLSDYQGLVVYANIERIAPERERALIDYVEGGKGLIALHCASYCFLNSEAYVKLVGARFQRHGMESFRTRIARPDHPIMKGFGGFESFDETYVHAMHHPEGRTVLEERSEGQGREPYTWVREQGKGRVFYTAWGHDERTWGNPGFQNLLERGIRWAVGGDPGVVPAFSDAPEMTMPRSDAKPFEFVEAKVPFYPAGKAWGTTADPISRMQKPLDPAESMKHMAHPSALEVKLFAAEPMIDAKPIAMNWDEQGRLWICETVDYPNEKRPEGQGRDRIVILEDTDGDGSADKKTVFAEKLSIPTSLLFANGGVIVHQAPDTLFLKDNDGDGKADERKVLFRGWSVNDTHAGPSNLRYGLDNWIYGIVGYSGFRGEIAGEERSFQTGFYRFKSDAAKFEFLRNTNNNSWGVGISEEGILFGSTANGCPSVHLPIPNRYYEGVRGWSSSVLGSIAESNRFYPITDKVRQVDQHGGFTSAAGHALYTARSYPKEYWNRAAFVTEPTGHLAATFVIQPDGAGYKSRNSWNLLAGDDEWIAPIMAEVGPDGSVWIIDWYNFIVQHNPTPAGFKTGKGNAYEIDLRDKSRGRVYRLVAKNAKPAPRISLKGASPETLVQTLKNDNMFWRLHAQRLLVERGKDDVAASLCKLAADPGVDEIGLNPAAMHALWTLHGLKLMNRPEAKAAALTALRHKSAGVRRNAILTIGQGDDNVKAIVQSGALSDPDPQVRLAGLLAVADGPRSASAAEAIAAAIGKPEITRDRWLTDAATAAAASQDREVLAIWAKTALPAQGAPNPATLTILTRVAEHYARGGPAETVSDLTASLDAAHPQVASAILAGLARGWPRDLAAKLNADQERALLNAFAKLPPQAQGQLATLAIRWGSKAFESKASAIADAFLDRVRDASASDADRISAAVQLIEFRKSDDGAARKLLDEINARSSPDLGAGLLAALAKSEAPAVGAALAERAPALTPSLRPAAMRLLLGRADWTNALLDAAESGELRLSDLTLDQQQALAVHPNRRVVQRARRLLERGGGLPNPDRQKVLDELAPLVKRTGDPVQGKAIFKNLCAKCHKHNGEGADIGPDLTGMAVHPKEELLVHIMDPSRGVEGNFRQYVVATADGRVLTGLLASETKTSVELIDSDAKKQVVLREDIESLKASSKSLMPEGFEKQLKPEELVNLLEFLTQRGRYVPIPLDKAATVVSTKGMFYDESGDVERLIFPDWSPKTFEGTPFLLVNPLNDRVRNVVLLYGPQGKIPPLMPRSVSLPCNATAAKIHFLSGISGWGFPYSQRDAVVMIVRLRYKDGRTEDHPLRNGQHFADYIRRVDVPQSKFAFALRGQQVRYFAIEPKRGETIERIELVKGNDASAPVVMAVTVETPR